MEIAPSRPAFILENVPLKDKNWFRTGGPARWYCEPKNGPEFQAALIWAKKENLPIFMLGCGANILISDEGFKGLVIHPQNSSCTITPDKDHAAVTAGAGVVIDDLITFCLDHNLIGLEEFSGIPGTVGGSVFINIHYFQFLLSQFLITARVINKNTGEVMAVDTNWFNFGYDYSTLHQGEFVLLEATFRLKKCTDVEAAFARGRQVEIIRHRRQRYPTQGTCGSFFRNFHENEVSIVSNGRKMIFIAYYLDKLGIKGELAIGDAIVSYQHANMLVNRGSATSADIIKLAQTMQQMVFEKFGITPHAECQFVGFDRHPLEG